MKKTSLMIVGVIWLLVGIGLSIAGIWWINGLNFGPMMVTFMSISVIVGLLKGRFVLKKIALKYYKRADLIQFSKNRTLSLLFGWVQVLGIRGFILIGLMMAMGSFLRHSSIDKPVLGIVYLAVGIALVYASKIFFSESKA